MQVKMCTTLRVIFFQNAELDVIPRYDKIKEKENLFLCEYAEKVSCNQQIRVSILKSCAQLFYLVTGFNGYSTEQGNN